MDVNRGAQAAFLLYTINLIRIAVNSFVSLYEYNNVNNYAFSWTPFSVIMSYPSGAIIGGRL